MSASTPSSSSSTASLTALNASIQQLRVELNALQSDRHRLEAEIEALSSTDSTHGQPLVDAEGFPRELIEHKLLVRILNTYIYKHTSHQYSWYCIYFMIRLH